LPPKITQNAARIVEQAGAFPVCRWFAQTA
jgi:hypothetical protein